MHYASVGDYALLMLFCTFLTPLTEVFMAAVGTFHAHNHYRMAPEKVSKAIIQVTTLGREVQLVRQAVAAVREYNLPFSHEIWVVIEPGFSTDYPEADRVIVVPPPGEFDCKPINKARALEYSRRIRVSEKLNRADVKISLMDDDSLPSRAYMIKALGGDYDICQGATVANREYGRHNLAHFLLSLVDNVRVRNCMIYCSFTQGVTEKPLFVHGEGLTFTGLVEDVITWDHPIIASDDLVFGTRAAAEGFSWGYFNAAIQIVSPWTFKAAWEQRKRWTWGNLQAIWSRDILPLSVAIPKGAKYLFGVYSVCASFAGATLLLTGTIHVPVQVHIVYWASLGLWLLTYSVAAWVNTSGQPNREHYEIQPQDGRPLRWHDFASRTRYLGWRVWMTVTSTILTPLISLVPVAIIISSVLTEPPKEFKVIDKSRPERVAA